MNRLASYILMTALAAGFLTACSTVDNVPISTRAVEERYFQLGEANRMYQYGEDLYVQGRYREAHVAFTAAEQEAYNKDLREASRRWRIYIERLMADLKEGRPAPAPPLTKEQIQTRRDKAQKEQKAAQKAAQPSAIEKALQEEAARPPLK